VSERISRALIIAHCFTVTADFELFPDKTWKFLQWCLLCSFIRNNFSRILSHAGRKPEQQNEKRWSLLGGSMANVSTATKRWSLLGGSMVYMFPQQWINTQEQRNCHRQNPLESTSSSVQSRVASEPWQFMVCSEESPLSLTNNDQWQQNNKQKTLCVL
jgi:hypothetical protein